MRGGGSSQFITILHRGGGVYRDPKFVLHNKRTVAWCCFRKQNDMRVQNPWQNNLVLGATWRSSTPWPALHLWGRKTSWSKLQVTRSTFHAKTITHVLPHIGPLLIINNHLKLKLVIHLHPGITDWSLLPPHDHELYNAGEMWLLNSFVRLSITLKR